MKKCRCCRQNWPLECFHRDGARIRASCYACFTNCGVHRRRRSVERTKVWKAHLRADVMAVRAARAA